MFWIDVRETIARTSSVPSAAPPLSSSMARRGFDSRELQFKLHSAHNNLSLVLPQTGDRLNEMLLSQLSQSQTVTAVVSMTRKAAMNLLICLQFCFSFPLPALVSSLLH